MAQSESALPGMRPSAMIITNSALLKALAPGFAWRRTLARRSLSVFGNWPARADMALR